MKIPVLCIAPYREWDNGVSGCVLVFNWDGGHPYFFLVDNDQRIADFTSNDRTQSFTPEEEQWFETFFEENGSLAACPQFTTPEDYHKYHFILLDNGLLADLLADCICTYLTVTYKICYRILKSDRLEQHLADLLSQNNLSDTVDFLQKALSADDWRLSILKSAMSVFHYDLLIHNSIQDTIDQCISHIGERLSSSGIAMLALVGEQLSIHMEQHPDDACWYRFVEGYLNDYSSIKLLHCTKYSIRQVIAFASLAKHYAVHPSIETSFTLEPLIPQERIAIFKMYFQNISEEEFKLLNEQDDPLCYKLPTREDAQISACYKMLDRCQFVPFWLPKDVQTTYENYEWAFRNYIHSEFKLNISSHLPSPAPQSDLAPVVSSLFKVSDRNPIVACQQAFNEIISSAPKRGKQTVLRKLHSTEYSFYFNCTAFSHQELANELNHLQQKYSFTTNDVDIYFHKN